MNESIIDYQESESTEYFAKPALIARVKSMIVDNLVVLFLMVLIAQVIKFLNLENSNIKFLLIAMAVFYEPIFTSLNKTLGQKLMGLKVIKLSNMLKDNSYANISIVHAIARFTSKVLLGWLSLLTIHSNDYGQAIHDRVADSVMVLD